MHLVARWCALKWSGLMVARCIVHNECAVQEPFEQIHPKLIHGNTLEWVLSGISLFVRGRKTKSRGFVFYRSRSRCRIRHEMEQHPEMRNAEANDKQELNRLKMKTAERMERAILKKRRPSQYSNRMTAPVHTATHEAYPVTIMCCLLHVGCSSG